MNTDLVAYYKERAKEYEKLYYKPERQERLQKATTILQQIFADTDLLEIACGTGYWTEKIAASARSITATDINEAVLEVARAKTYTPATVCFDSRDMYALEKNCYNALFGGFIWSHIKLEELPAFINTVDNYIEPGGTIVFMDNIYVAGSNLPVTETDSMGNTYQTRRLEDGSEHRVLKNFPAEELIRNMIRPYAAETEYYDMEYYWMVRYTKRS